MTRNVELLEKVMQHIEDHPEQHEQAEWGHPCGAAMCFAGWSAWFAFGRAVMTEDGGFDLPAPYNEVDGRGGYPRMTLQAARLLGLTETEAHCLFDASNTRDMLRLMVKDLVNGDELLELPHYEAEADAR